MISKQRLTVVIALAAIAWLAELLHPTAPLAEQTLTILHTSEHHGQALPIEQRGQKKVGGMAGRATLITQIRHENATVLVVDSGDILIGTPLSSFFHGEPDIKAMNLMSYQAMAAGNHEFDFGLDHLRRLRDLAQFPMLCSNLTSRTVELPCQSSAVVQVGPFSIGVLSLLGHRNFPDTFNRQVAKILELRNPVEAARSLAQMLRATHGVDLVVAVTHQETEEDLAVLAQAPEVDIIIGGHTEGFDGLRVADKTSTFEELENPGPVFVKTHRLGKTLGRLDLQLAKQPGMNGVKIVRAKAQNLPVTEEIAPDPTVNDLVQDYARKLESKTAEVVGRSLATLDGENSRIRSQETNLGNLLADLLRAEFGTDVALVNGGQIRDGIPPGPVDVKRVLRVLPFDSPTVTLTITGEQLRQVLENSVSQLPGSQAGRFLQVSGLSVLYDLSAKPGARVQEVTVGGKPLEPVKRYSVATDAFLADGGDGFTMFAAATDRIERQLPMRDLLLAALQAGPLKASLEGRIRFLEPTVPAEPRQPAAPPAPAHTMPGH